MLIKVKLEVTNRRPVFIDGTQAFEKIEEEERIKTIKIFGNAVYDTKTNEVFRAIYESVITEEERIVEVKSLWLCVDQVHCAVGQVLGMTVDEYIELKNKACGCGND